MDYSQINDFINLHHVGCGVFEEKISYIDINSPFYRIYYVTKGQSELLLHNQVIKMEQGHMYLVPAFESCTYLFQKDFSHIYIHCTFFFEKSPVFFGKFNLSNAANAKPIDELLFKRLLELHADLNIPHHDPSVYEKKLWMNKDLSFNKLDHFFETVGIIQQLYSRFIITVDSKKHMFGHISSLNQVLSFINNNLHNNLKIAELAHIANLSENHFSKVFKALIGVGPNEFIIKKRLEKAKLQLLFSDHSLQNICSHVGFHSLSYFSKTFKKHFQCSPKDFRKNNK